MVLFDARDLQPSRQVREIRLSNHSRVDCLIVSQLSISCQFRLQTLSLLCVIDSHIGIEGTFESLGHFAAIVDLTDTYIGERTHVVVYLTIEVVLFSDLQYGVSLHICGVTCQPLVYALSLQVISIYLVCLAKVSQGSLDVWLVTGKLAQEREEAIKEQARCR